MFRLLYAATQSVYRCSKPPHTPLVHAEEATPILFSTCFACSMPFHAAPFSLLIDSQPALHPCNVFPMCLAHSFTACAFTPAMFSQCAWPTASQPALHPCNDVFRMCLDARPQGVFDMFRLLNAATQPLRMDPLCRRSVSCSQPPLSPKCRRHVSPALCRSSACLFLL